MIFFIHFYLDIKEDKFGIKNKRKKMIFELQRVKENDFFFFRN